MSAIARLLRHIREWRAVLKEENRRGSWRGMLKAILSGGVTLRAWRRRMRVCLKCPVFDGELRRCRSYWPREAGCGCYTVWLAKTRRPYAKGCWGRTFVGDDFGWE